MSAVELFRYEDREVRTVLVDGEPWFVAADVCAVLGYSHTASALRTLRDKEKGVRPMHTPGGEQDVTVISEQGLYRLVMRSNRAEAERFQDWVTGEVLPAIRRTGTYSTAPALPDITTPAGVLAMAEQFAATARQLVAAEEKVAELEPAATSWQTLATAEGDFLVADAAKILSRDPRIKLGRDRLFTLLSELHWIHRQPGDGRWRCYQTAIETGRLSEMPMSHYHPRTGELVLDPPQIRVTVKGLGWLHRHLRGQQQLAVGGAA